jgi:hypothetical protein
MKTKITRLILLPLALSLVSCGGSESYTVSIDGATKLEDTQILEFLMHDGTVDAFENGHIEVTQLAGSYFHVNSLTYILLKTGADTLYSAQYVKRGDDYYFYEVFENGSSQNAYYIENVDYEIYYKKVGSVYAVFLKATYDLNNGVPYVVETYTVDKDDVTFNDSAYQSDLDNDPTLVEDLQEIKDDLDVDTDYETKVLIGNNLDKENVQLLLLAKSINVREFYFS